MGMQRPPYAARLLIKKHLATVFWDSKGPLLVEVLPQGHTITAEVYCQQLDNLRIAVRDKRRRQHMHDYYFLQDNARPHTANLTKEKLAELGINIIPHPPYSPDISPSDFYLFSPLKSSLRGKRYLNAHDAMNDVDAWLAGKDRAFFSKAFSMLPDRWRKCINANGEYFDHLYDND